MRGTGSTTADDSGLPTGRTGPARALARRADGPTGTVVGLHGWQGAVAAVAHAVGTNACGHHSATPYLTLPAHPGGTHLLVTLVVLSADPDMNDDPHARGSGTRVRVAVAGEVEIRFPDGTRERVP
ncbi:T-complex 10 C-terminal domain-containing protein [Streptomyces massasporeus]|uniref:T-complex 10 C-terminal domain-containing protein n=1 Tax=Streptomyces massasporeus TaxID=67324 RepID=UPI0037151225